MSYEYQQQRTRIFSEEGVRTLLYIYRTALRLLEKSGSFTANYALYGDSWVSLACLDYLCEQGILREVEQVRKPAGQDRIFVAGAYVASSPKKGAGAGVEPASPG